MDYAKIKADAAQFAPADTDAQAVANAINSAPGVNIVGTVPMSDVLIWAGVFGVTAAIQARAQKAGDALQSAAASLILALQGGYPTLDLSSAQVQTMLNGFVAAGDVSPQAQAALTAMGTTLAPYPIATYGRQLTDADVLTAWRQP